MFEKITSIKPELKKYITKNPSIYPIRTGKALLDKPKIDKILKRLASNDMVNVPSQHYQVLYADVLEKYAYFVQGLPAIKFISHNYHGGLLELGIERTFKALQSYRLQHPVGHLKPEEVPAKLARWTYALFTAALFYGLGQVEAIYWVGVSDEKGQNPKRWRPLAESIDELGTHYRYTYEAIEQDDLAARATTLIAKQLMPEEGFSWIASDQEIFAFWLAILQNDERASGFLIKHLMDAQEQLLTERGYTTHVISGETPDLTEEEITEENLEEKNKEEKKQTKEEKKQESKNRLLDSQAQKSALDVAGPLTLEIGEHFINWLRNAVIGHGASIHRLNDGRLFVGSDAFQAFIRENPQYKNWQAAFQQVQQRYGVGGQQRFQDYSSGQRSMVNPLSLSSTQKTIGAVIDPSVVFHTKSIPTHIAVLGEGPKLTASALVGRGLPNLKAPPAAESAKPSGKS